MCGLSPIMLFTVSNVDGVKLSFENCFSHIHVLIHVYPKSSV